VVAAREVDVKRRLGEERLRIARDLHDSVANALTVINLQASKAHRHLGDESTQTEEALRVVDEVSRQTVRELAGILSVLRDDDAVEDHDLPSASNIPHLIELFTATGASVDVELSTLADLDLTPASSTALYRIAQEALTNAQRHGAAPVTLRAGRAEDRAWLEVRNALGAQPRATESGFGIEGMTERAALAGGTLSADMTEDQFIVRAEVPLRQERS
jgi:signal transduction histidine kinase